MRRIALFGLLATFAVCAVAHAVDRKSFALYTGAATDTVSVGMACSTSVIGTAQYQRLYLHLLPNKGCRVAVQVRQHGITDTARASLPDSNNTAAWAWRAYTGAAGALGNQADSALWARTTAPTSVVAGEDEFVVEFPDNEIAQKWGGPRGRYLSLREIDTGIWYWGRLTSIRFRVLTSAGGGVVTLKSNLDCVTW